MAADGRPELPEPLSLADLSAAGIRYIIGSGRHHGYVVARCPCCDLSCTLRVPLRAADGLEQASCEHGCAIVDVVGAIDALREQLREPGWLPARGRMRELMLHECVEREIAPRVQRAVEHDVELQAQQRASLERDPDWSRSTDELRARGLSYESCWRSEAEIRRQRRLDELDRLVGAGRELAPVQWREILELRRGAATGSRYFASKCPDRDGLLAEIARSREQEYAAATHARPRPLTAAVRRRRGHSSRRSRARRRRRRARSPSAGDDGPGSSEPHGLATGRQTAATARAAAW